MHDVGVGSWIERWARIAPERPALIARERRVGYGELAGRIRRLANGFRQLGVARGDRVAWIGPNDPAFLEAMFAAGSIGAALAPVNERLPAEDRASVLADTEPAVLIEHHAMEPTPIPPSVRHRLIVREARAGAQDLEHLVASSPDDPVEATVGLDDLFLLPHTSGTTGRPKGVMLTNGNVTWNALNFLTATDFRRDDVTIAIAPFFRVGGTGVNVLPLFLVGGTVIVPDRSDPDGILSLIEQHRVSVGFANPDLLAALTGSAMWATADLSSVRFIITGGAPVPERLLRTYWDRGVRLVQGYGLSEAGPLALLLDADTALRKPGSAGRPPLFVDVRIVDPEGRDVAAGEAGELIIRGPNVMAGYWNQPDSTAAVISADGWLRTGDAARADDEGDVAIVDRVESRYVTSAGAVYPGDVERSLMAHPLVADAGVVGIPGTDRGDVGAAFVVRMPGASLTEAELLSFVRPRLDGAAVPSSIRFVDLLPRSSVGKLLRHELRARALSERT